MHPPTPAPGAVPAAETRQLTSRMGAAWAMVGARSAPAAAALAKVKRLVNG